MRLKTLAECVVLFALMCVVPGCASAGEKKGGWFSGLFTAKVADEVKAADKIQGAETVNARVADKAEAKAVDNSRTETTSNNAGGSITTSATSDPVVMTSVASGLFGLMGSLIFYMFLTIRQKDKQIANLMAGQQAFIKQQEEGQVKYIEMLERIAMTVIDTRLKEVR